MTKQTMPYTMSNDKTDCEKIYIIYLKYVRNFHKLSCIFPKYMVFNILK